MHLTELERSILELAKQELNDYKIARKLNIDPPTVTRSHKNANKKLLEETIDLEWATKTGITNLENRELQGLFLFFL
jgi:hypothetical protein